jgi:hypothetical protein
VFDWKVRWGKLCIYVKALGANKMETQLMENIPQLYIGFGANKDVKWGAISIGCASVGPKDFAYMGSILHLTFHSNTFPTPCKFSISTPPLFIMEY